MFGCVRVVVPIIKANVVNLTMAAYKIAASSSEVSLNTWIYRKLMKAY